MNRPSQQLNPEEFREWNERMLKKYDPDAFHHHSSTIVRFIERKRVKAIFEVAGINQEDCAVEIGCGAGNVVEKASACKLFGTDISSSVLAKARRRLSQKAHLFQSDVQNLPCKNQTFSKIICSEVLEHLMDPAGALTEMSRILKTGGAAVISIPNESMINRIKSMLIHLGIFGWLFCRSGDYREMSQRMEDEWHLHAFELKEWLSLFKKCFKVSHLRRVPFFWLPLRYVVRLEKTSPCEKTK
jgi:ubiquinone/menaquinone biosynthesis C-methylase UbiE